MGDGESSLDANIVDNYLEICCINFKVTGSGTTESIQITKIENKVVKLHL